LPQRALDKIKTCLLLFQKILTTKGCGVWLFHSLTLYANYPDQVKDQNDILEFVRTNYQDYLEYLRDKLPLVNDDKSLDFHSVLVFKLMPKMHSLRDGDETYVLLQEILKEYFNDFEFVKSSNLRKVSDGLYDLYFANNRDLKSEKQNKIHKIIGIISMFFNLSYILLMLLFDSGYSLGLAFRLISLVLWLVPSILAYSAIKKNPSSFFHTRHKFLLVINCLLAIFFMFLTYFYVLQIVK
jgi:hypothetical protein